MGAHFSESSSAFHSGKKVTRSQREAISNSRSFQLSEGFNFCALGQLCFPLRKGTKSAIAKTFSVALSVPLLRHPQAEAPCIPCFALPPAGMRGRCGKGKPHQGTEGGRGGAVASNSLFDFVSQSCLNYGSFFFRSSAILPLSTTPKVK